MKIVKIADRIKKLKGVQSDSDVAELLGMSRTAFAERKRRDSIPYEELVRFAEQESISVDWLLTGEGEMLRHAKEKPLMVREESAVYNERDAEIAEIVEWLKNNPKDKRLVLKLVKVKKEVGEAFEGLEFKIILKEEG